jgi:MFS family permease
VPLVIATSAVTAYLLGGTAGIVMGGFLAVRTTRHDRVAATGLLAGAGLLSLVAANAVPVPWIVPTFVAIGVVVGATGPSRDLIVRNATPKGAAGRVYGFVYSGLDLGAMLGPVWFGLMLDHGLAREVFFVIGALFVVAIGTVVQVRRAAAPQVA